VEIAGFISIGLLVVVQIGYFAYSFGKLDGTVKSIDKRLNDLTHRYDIMEERIRDIEIAVARKDNA